MKKLRKILIVISSLIAILYLCNLSIKERYGEKFWTNEIIAMDGKNGVKIKIVEQVKRKAWPLGTYDANLELWYFDQQTWRLVDKSVKRTPVYTKLYSPQDKYIQLSDPLDFYKYRNGMGKSTEIMLSEEMKLKYPTVLSYKTSYVWDIFINPNDFSSMEYEMISSLVMQNQEILSKTIAKPRPPKKYSSSWGRSPILGSIVFRQYDYYPRVGLQHSVGMHFKSPGSDLFISQDPPNSIEMILRSNQPKQSEGRTIYETDMIGQVTDDQEFVLIREPSNAKIKAIVGDNWMEFYSSCLNEDGKNIFHYYKPIPWDKRDELKEN